jgi:hypothetical protein
MENIKSNNERSANDQRSDVKNDNNLEFQKDKINSEQQKIKDKKLDILSDIVIDYPELFIDNH